MPDSSRWVVPSDSNWAPEDQGSSIRSSPRPRCEAHLSHHAVVQPGADQESARSSQGPVRRVNVLRPVREQPQYAVVALKQALVDAGKLFTATSVSKLAARTAPVSVSTGTT